jgi:PAS domain S-box-containing protein
MKTVNTDPGCKKAPGALPLIQRFVVAWLPAMLALAAAVWTLNGLQQASLAPLKAGTDSPIILALLLSAIVLAIAHGMRRWRAEETLQASEARFRTLLESAPDAIVIVDRDGRITLANAQAERNFGYPRDELLNQPVEILVPETLRDRHQHHRADYAAKPHTRAMGEGMELHGRRKDGSEFPVEISLSPLKTPQGMIVTAIIRDITRRRQVEHELQRRTIELEALNQELEAFSYSVSHDLRAPLRAIDGFSRILLSDYADRLDDTGRSHLERVRRAAQNMGLLIDDLLKLSRVTRTELRNERVDLSALANEVTEELRKQEPKRIVHFAISPGLMAHGDRGLLRIVLDNLLGNAWKFSSGLAEARIGFGVATHNGRPAYVVSDNGAGFDMTYADKLFGVFQRLHDARDFPGTGIGLATVQRIIHKHGGKIWAESGVGEGAQFYFTLEPETPS